MVASFDFYTDEYYGKLLSAEEFPEYSTRADAHLNELTYGKYASSDIPENVLRAVKLSECAIADLLCQYQSEAESNPAIYKETIGSHSVTYRTGEEATSGLAVRIYDTAARYLLTTGLLYRGAILQFKL